MGDFNARLSGEEEIFGTEVFSNSSVDIPLGSNRHLLVELCQALGLAIGNTFFENAPERQVTCYNIGHKPMDTVSWASHSQIDFVLYPQAWMQQLKMVSSSRLHCLASHHFLTKAILNIKIEVPA